jgi:hypothetical protein
MSGMSGAVGSSSGLARGWRGQTRVKSSSRGSRFVGRAFFSLLGLVLLGFLGWILTRWWFLPNVYFVGLPVVDYHALAVPPVPFAQEDLQEFSAASPRGAATILRELQHIRAVSTLGARLRSIVPRSKDTLILYTIAQGVSDDGKAYLLCSDFSASSGTGRYPLGEFLAQVGECPAALIVLVLDAEHIPADPRLGMLPNEFARLLEEEVARIKDPRIWVLAAAKPLEVSHTLPSMRRSVFGYFVAEGLRGAADRDGDGIVQLDEFARYVQDGVGQWVHDQSGGGESQTPRLLAGGVGEARPASGLALVPVVSRRPEIPAESESPEAESPTAKQDNAASLSGQVRGLLGEAWALCDRVQGRKGPDVWCPIDYAPHLWREYQELLLGYELRYRAGSAYDLRQLADNLRNDILSLRDLLDRGTIPASLGKASVVARLRDARQRFLAGKAKASFEPSAEHLRELGEAIRLANDVVYRLPDYVRLAAALSRSSPQPPPLSSPVADLATQRLPAFLATIESMLQSDANGNMRVADFEAALPELTRQKAAIEKLRATIEKEIIERDLVDLAGRTAETGIPERIERYLAQPLPSAEVRMRLLDHLAMPGRASPQTAPTDKASDRGSSPVPQWKWKRLFEQAQLEAAVASLVTGTARSRSGTTESSVTLLSPPGRVLADNEAWEAYRRFGTELGVFHRNLPERIRGAIGVSRWDAICTGSRALRLVDARDVAGIPEDAALLALQPMGSRPTPAGELQFVAGPKALTLQPGEWFPFEIVLRATGPAAADVAITCQYDPAAMEVIAADAEGERQRPATPGVSLPVSLATDQTARLRLKARGKNAAGEPQVGPIPRGLSIQAVGGQQTASFSMEVTRAPPDVVDLLIQGSGPTVESRGESPDTIWLRPFPNRSTSYRFVLVNRSGRKRNVTVKLDTLGDSGAAMGTLCEAAVELPAEPTAVPFPFPAAKPAAPKEPSAKPAELPKTAPEPPPWVSFGVGCRIRDTAPPHREWTRRIRFSPLTPKEYLDPRVSYDAQRRRILIRLQPRDADGDGKPDLAILPPGPDAPIDVVWETADLLEPGTQMNDRAQLTAPAYQAELFAEVAPRPNRVIWVQLTVDGCPRAFIYQVPCDLSRERIDRERSLRRVRITQPTRDQALKSPLDRLPVVFQVDAPEDAFQNDKDRVELGIDEDGTRQFSGGIRREFLTDRQIDVAWQEATPQGEVKVRANVSDFKTFLSPGGLRNKKVEVVARLRLAARAGQERGPAENAVPIVLDGAVPVLRVNVPASPTTQGSPLEIICETEDLSGVVQIEFGFDLDNSGELKAAANPKVLQQADGRRISWTTSLPTEKLEPGRYRLLVRATDAAGWTSKDSALVTVAAAMKPDAAKSQAAMGAIQGKVRVFEQPCTGFQVKLQGGGNERTATTDENGEFAFRDVPPGQYTIHSSGFHRNRARKGTKSVTVAGTQEPTVVEIQAE